MKKFLFLTFLFISLTRHTSFAQQTGDFQIGFPSPDTLLTEDSVHLHFHVPVSYQPGNPAKLIVGVHGLGNPQTPEQIRNYFSPTGDSLYAIVLCPKPYINSQPINIDHPRSQLVVSIAIDSVLQWYNIDTNEIYIAGYSAGSDVASQFVLQNHMHRFKGLIWYAPGFFKSPNLSAQTSFPATCLCYGDEDPLSNLLNQVTSIRDSFAQSPFDLFYNEIPGVAHTMEFPNFTREMLECFRFFNDPENFVPDSSYVGERSIAPSAFRFYPNPTIGEVFFDGMTLTEATNLQVTDISGKVIFEIPDFNGTQQINLTGFAAGTYLLSLQGRETNYFRRIILLGQ